MVSCIANLNVKEKCIFIDVPKISSDNAFKIGLYGNLKTIGVSGFANEVVNVSSGYTPTVKKIELESFEKRDISFFWQFFNIRELPEIPLEVAAAYREYRKIFINTPYMLPLKKYDLAYNSKVRRREFRMKI